VDFVVASQARRVCRGVSLSLAKPGPAPFSQSRDKSVARYVFTGRTTVLRASRLDQGTEASARVRRTHPKQNKTDGSSFLAGRLDREI
jgi:hypothetical protein